MSVSLEDWAVTDHGALSDRDGRIPIRINALAADEAGRVYMVGDWTLLPDEQGSQRYWGQVGQFRFDETDRGLRFAVVDLSAAAPLQVSAP